MFAQLRRLTGGAFDAGFAAIDIWHISMVALQYS
jgi:hypothetical protein